MHVRERGQKKEEEEKKAQKKPLRRDRDLNPQTLSPEQDYDKDEVNIQRSLDEMLSTGKTQLQNFHHVICLLGVSGIKVNV